MFCVVKYRIRLMMFSQAITKTFKSLNSVLNWNPILSVGIWSRSVLRLKVEYWLEESWRRWSLVSYYLTLFFPTNCAMYCTLYINAAFYCNHASRFLWIPLSFLWKIERFYSCLNSLPVDKMQTLMVYDNLSTVFWVF